MLRKVLRNHKTGVESTFADRLTEVVRRRVVGVQSKHQTFRERRNEIAAFRRGAVVDDSEAKILEIGVQCQSKENEVQRGRNDQQDHEPAVAPDLVKLFDEE